MMALRLLLLEKDSDSAVGYLHLEKELGDHDKMGGMTPIVDKWKSKSLTHLPLLPHLPHYPLITPPPTTYYLPCTIPSYLPHLPLLPTTRPLYSYHTSYLPHLPTTPHTYHTIPLIPSTLHSYNTSYLPYHPPHTFDTSFLPHLIHHPLIPTTPSPS